MEYQIKSRKRRKSKENNDEQKTRIKVGGNWKVDN